MRRALRSLAVAMIVAAPAVAAAQGPHGAQHPVQSVVGSQNKDQPIQIEAKTLEVRDKHKTATFSGDVQVVQGDTTMKCRTLVVFYGQEVGIAAAPAANGGQQPASTPRGAQNIRRIEARGGVTVTTKDQRASGDIGVYDLKTKTITLSGHVVVSQGKNVLHGERVIVDTTTGNARVESGVTAQNRVRALIIPAKGANGTSTNIMTFGTSRTN